MQKLRLGVGRQRSVIALLAMTALAMYGCTVTEYEKPVSDFSSATSDAEAALIGLNNQITEAYTEQQSNRVVSKELQPRYYRSDESSVEDCLVQSSRCRLELIDRDGENQGIFPQNAALRNMIVLMASVRMYAKNLEDLVKADTSAKVSASVNSTLGSVSSLADSVQKIGGVENTVDLEEYKTPIGDLIDWFVGNYVAAVKLDGLRRATTAADPVIAEASKVIGIAADAGSDIPKAALAEAASMRNDAFAEDRTASNLEKLIADAAAFDQFLLAKPDGVFAQMADAHHALTENLQGESPSIAVVAKKIKDFLAESENLLRIIEELRSAGKEEEQ